MKTGTFTAADFVKGMGGKQEYFKQGRKVKKIFRSQIDSYCDCRYLTLKATNHFESFNGGLTVKRSNVEIIDDDTGKVVKILRARKDKDGYDDISRMYQCNACGNNWK